MVDFEKHVIRWWQHRVEMERSFLTSVYQADELTETEKQNIYYDMSFIIEDLYDLIYPLKDQHIPELEWVHNFINCANKYEVRN